MPNSIARVRQKVRERVHVIGAFRKRMHFGPRSAVRVALPVAILSLQLLFVDCKTSERTKDLFIETSLCSGQPNTNVPWTGTPTLVKEVANGSLYTVGEYDDLIYGKE